jgi:hypothetical protein
MRLIRVVTYILIALGAAFAQSDRGNITGTVSDPANAVVPSANVAATNLDSGAQFKVETSATGNYTLASLPPGHYEITVEVPGFKKFTQTGILVQVAQNERIDIVLQVGSATDSITISAEASQLKTEDAEMSHTMTGAEIGALPINFSVLSGGYVRSPFAFITNEPGANNTGQNIIRVNGMPNSSQTMMFEGQEATNAMSAARIDELQPSVEAIEAAALQTSNFAPEFGQIVGGLFNFNAKSGTNDYHGSAYDYLANDAFNAGIPFTNSGNGHLIRPAVRKNDFGFSIGGPVYIPKVYNGKNKTFFFLSWEFYKEHRYTTGVYQTLPTTAMRNGDFSQLLTGRNLGTDIAGRAILENTVYDPATAQTINGNVITNPFPGNIIPQARISPVSAKIQALIPAVSNGQLVNNWQQTYPAPKFQSVPSIKFDQVFSKQKVTFYYSEFRTDQYVTPDGLPSPITGLRILYERNRTMRLSDDYTVSPSLLIHAGFGYIMYRNPDMALNSVLAYDAPAQLGLIGGVYNDFSGSNNTGFPRLTALTTASYGMGLNMGPANANKYAFDKPTAVLNASYVRGNHSFKVGADWRIDAYRNRNVVGASGNYTFSPNETSIPGQQTASVGGGALGNAYASFLLGLADSAGVSTEVDPQFRKTTWSLFVQDNWKVTRKLTINYGVRWDLQGAPDEIHQRIAEFSATTPNPAVGGLPGATIYEGYGAGRCNCKFVSSYGLALGPRLGIAYQVTPKTVIRAGWGLTYGTTSNFNYLSSTLGGGSIGYNSITFVSPGFGTPAANFAQGLPYTPAQLHPATLSAGIVPFTGQLNSPPYWMDPNGGRPPRINQWNIGFQRELTADLVVEAAYVANRGVWLQANNLDDINGLTQQKLSAAGLSLNNAANLSLLSSTFASGKPQAAGFSLPYATFPQASTLAQALRPFPQFTNISTLWVPRGKDWFDSLQAKARQRLRHGLNMQIAFTWQKELTDAEGTAVNDVYNLPENKIISGSSVPFATVASFTYTIPTVASWNPVVKSAVKEWTLGGSLRYQSGVPIQAPYATNNLATALPRAVGSNMTYATPTGQPFFTQDPNCHCFDPNTTFILNPAAWSQPAAGQWGAGAPYYNNYRWQRQPSESLSLGRTFKLKERMSLEFRAEFFNIFNRNFFTSPTNTPSSATQSRNAAGQAISGFGWINTSITNIQTGGAIPTTRNGQLVARIRW